MEKWSAIYMVILRKMDMVYFFESENTGYMLNIKDDLKFRVDRNDSVVYLRK